MMEVSTSTIGGGAHFRTRPLCYLGWSKHPNIRPIFIGDFILFQTMCPTPQEPAALSDTPQILESPFF